MKFCSSCGCENIDEAQFCRNCGLKFDEINQTTQNVTKVDNTPQKSKESSDNVNSIVSKLFYKTDKYTGELRIAKVKSISIGVFLLAFLFGIFNGTPGGSFAIVFVAAIIFGLMFAVPILFIGFVIGLIVDKITH